MIYSCRLSGSSEIIIFVQNLKVAKLGLHLTYICQCFTVLYIVQYKQNTLYVLITLVGGFEVNFMDDVGQTLLNWASAFGTLEMVGFQHRQCKLTSQQSKH